MRVSRIFLFLLMTAAVLAAGWASLHSQAGFVVRQQPLAVLTPAQEKALKAAGRAEVLAFTAGNPRLIKSLQDMVQPLKRYLPDLTLKIVNPDTNPDLVQRYDITQPGQLVVLAAGKSEKLAAAAPEAVLQAVLNLQGGGDAEAVHVQSSGERAFLADSGGSWRPLYSSLNNPHLHTSAIDLARSVNIPANAQLAVIADPGTGREAHLNAALDTFIREGGNVLYTTDTVHPNLPPVLAQLSGLALLPGTVVDMAGKSLGYDDPRVLPAAASSSDILTAGLPSLPLLAGSAAFAPVHPPAAGWRRSELLKSSALSWNETSPVTGHIAQDGAEVRGPLGVGFVLSREFAGRQQRIVILGDSDLFTAQAFSLGGNRLFAQNVMAELAGAQMAQSIARPDLPDQFIQLSNTRAYALAVVLLLALPALALLAAHWLRRRIRAQFQAMLP